MKRNAYRGTSVLHPVHRSQVCGRAELAFLTNSGLWFGYLLGVFQMILWMFWDNPWTLTIGGAVVGCPEPKPRHSPCLLGQPTGSLSSTLTLTLSRRSKGAVSSPFHPS